MAQRDGMHDVTSADDANQLLLPHNRHALDFALCEQGGNIADGRLFTDGRNFATHDIGHTQPILVEQPIAVDLADNVCFRDDTYEAAAGINYRESTDTL